MPKGSRLLAKSVICSRQFRNMAVSIWLLVRCVGRSFRGSAAVESEESQENVRLADDLSETFTDYLSGPS